MKRTLRFPSGLVAVLLLHAAGARAQAPVKCGFPEIAALHTAARHDAQARDLLKAALQRPILDFSYVTPDGRFKIHYTLTGPDAVDPVSTNSAGVPDFVHEAGVVAQRAHALLVDVLGMREPASDNASDGPEFDFYVNNRPRSEYGRTVPEFAGGSGPSYILVDNDFGAGYYTHGLDALRVTVAHEYFHAVQLNYYYRLEDVYFLELSSVWFEDYAYDDINDYFNYLRSWFANTTLPLNTSNNSHEYGSGIWLHYLTKRLGTADIVRSLWERVVSEPAVFATRYVLQSPPFNLPFDQAMQEFYNWCVFTGYRADAEKYFEEGGDYPLIPFDANNSFRITENRDFPSKLPPLAARYYRFIRAGLDLQFSLNVGSEPGRWSLTTVTHEPESDYVLKSDRAGAVISVPGLDREDTVFVAVANVGLPPNAIQSPPAADFQLQVRLGAQLDLPNVLEKPRPNPVFLSRGDILVVPFRIKDRTEVKAVVLREDGRVMWNKSLGTLPAGPHRVDWNGIDNDGRRVSSGVYFVRLLAGSLVESAKFVLINQ